MNDQAERLRERQNRRGKNHRNNAARIDSQRKVRRLSAKNATADDAFGVLNGNSPLPALHQDDERDNGHHDRDQNDQRRARTIRSC